MANNEIGTGKKPERVEPEQESGGQYLLGYCDGVPNVGSCEENVGCKESKLMLAVIDAGNMRKALAKVRANRGAAGVDRMTVEQLPEWLRSHWVTIRSKLLEGSYKPQAVRRVAIPKPDGGERILGIPTVLDRLIQQAISQVLTLIFDPYFSEESYGFRPGRSARQAVRKAQAYQHEGKRWVVDLDLEKFFDLVNHDILMGCLRKRVEDRVLLQLIGRYLRAGMMDGGMESQRQQGTPQGGPLSPLLSNILLDRFDKELSKRNHSYVRYADDCNIYVQSEKAGQRVLENVTKWLSKVLKLKVNASKSTVDRPWKRKFLGYSVTSNTKAKLRIAPQSVKRFKSKVKLLMRMGRGRNLGRFVKEDLNPLLRGWVYYFRATETKGILDELDGWIRRRLRAILWRQWKRPPTRRAKLMQRGLGEATASKSAYNGRGTWWNSGASHMNLAFQKKYFDQLQLVNLQAEAKFVEQLALF